MAHYNTAQMKNLNQLKEQLRNLLVKDGILTAIHSLKEQLPSQSPLLNQLTLIEKADIDLRQNVVKGIIGYTEIAQERAKNNNRFLALVEGLKAADFDRKIRRSSFGIQEKIKKGGILYHIPTQMALNERATCKVRIAFDRETILESLNLDKDTGLKENVKISRKMEVTLMDSTEAVFEIKAMNTKEQFVEIDDFTEWSFYVTPLKAGKHLLVFRVTIMVQMENGEWRRREKTLEESVVIVSEPLQDIAIEKFKRIQNEIIVSHSPLMAQQPAYRLPQNLRASAVALLSIILSSIATYAAIPTQAEFWAANIQGAPDAFENYIQQFYEERTPRFEAALFAVAKIKKNDPTALQRYEAEYGEEGKFAEAIEQIKIDRRDSLVAKSIRKGDKLPLQSLRQIYSDIKMDPCHIVNQRLVDLGTTLSLPTPNPVIELQEIEKPKTEEQLPKSKQDDKTIKLVDKDHDGVPNTNNNCPNEKGTIENNGCLTQLPLTTSHIPPTIFVPAGTFTMGCLSEERDGNCSDDEKPARSDVKVDAFYIGKYEVTNEEFAAFLNAKGNQEEEGSEWVDLEGEFGDVKCRIQKDGDRFVVEEGFEKHPMIYVSWYGARAYCQWLSQQTGQNYRLPSEAEWEYAARGAEQGAKDKFLYSGSNTIDEVAWYDGNSGNQTHEVGKQQPNQLGLYDMSGNVREWCADPWHDNYANAPQDAKVWDEGGNNLYRVLRGGSWNYDPWNCRVASRFNSNPDFRFINNGFRVARDH